MEAESTFCGLDKDHWDIGPLKTFPIPFFKKRINNDLLKPGMDINVTEGGG